MSVNEKSFIIIFRATRLYILAVRNKTSKGLVDDGTWIGKAKIMKTYVVLLLTVCMVFVCLTSCGNSYEENEWYSEDTLEECIVPDLPEPSKTYLKKGASVFVSFSDTEYTAYVGEVYEYLKSLNFKYFGTRGEMFNTLAGIGTTYYFKPANALSEFHVDGTYYFVFSDGWNEDGKLSFYTLAIYEYQSGLLQYGSHEFYFNTKIVLRKGGAAPLDGGYLLKFNPITYADDLVELLCEGYAPSEAAVGERVFIRTHPILDTDFNLYANDVKIEQIHAGSDYWEYTFVMPDERVIITHKTVGDSQILPEPDMTYLFCYEEWLSSLSTDAISEIKTVQRNPSVYLEHFYKYIYRTIDRDVIADVLQRYQNMMLEPIHVDSVPLEGGGLLSVEFVLTDGSTHTVDFEAGCYKQNENVYYEVSENLSFDRFERLLGLNVWAETHTAYTKDGTAIAELTELSALEFDYYGWNESYTRDMYTHYIETEIGRLYIVSETVFFFVTFDEWIAPECYELKNGNFYGLFDIR